MKMFPKFFGALKKGINLLASYYTKSWKKTAHFGEFCDRKGYKRFKMRPTHDVRWVHSYHQVILLILVHWLPLFQHLMDINANIKGEWDKEAMEKAGIHINFLRDKNAMIGVAICADISNRFTVDSMTFQRRFGSLIGQAERESKLVVDLKKIANGEGKYTQEFLASCICYKNPNKSDKKKCTDISMYESSFVDYKGVELLDMGSNGLPKLTSVINAYLEEVLKSITKYFPHTFTRKTHPAKLNMAMFSPFNQAEWSVGEISRGNVQVGSIKEVAAAVRIPFDNQLQKEFENLKHV